MKIRRITAIILAAVMLAVLAACGGSGTEGTTAGAAENNQTQAADNGSNENNQTQGAVDAESVEETEEGSIPESIIADSVTIGITANPENLSPVATNNDGNNAMRRSFYEPLMELVGGKYEMVLMESYEKVDDLTYAVTIHDNIYDQAGNHMTASDVEFTYHEFRRQIANGLASYKDCEATGDYTINFYINEENNSVGCFEQICAEIFCVTEAAFNASPDGMINTPCGTGRYEVTNYVAGSSLTAKKADSYWNEDGDIATLSQANVNEITWLIIPEPTQISIALETGTIDGSSAVADADMVNFVNGDGTAKNGFNIQHAADHHIYDLQFNARDRQCADVKVRQAICYAIDADAIGLAAFGSNAVKLYQEAIESCPDYDIEKYEKEDYYGYDVDKAKALLKDAGYPNGGFELDLICAQSDYYETMAQLIQAYLEEIGITVNLHVYEATTLRTFIDTDEGNFDLYLNAHFVKTYLSDGMMNQLSTATSYGLNYSMIKDEKLDSLIMAAQNPQTASTDATSEMLDYMKEACYLYGITGLSKQIVTTDKIAKAAFNSANFIMPGACVYAAN